MAENHPENTPIKFLNRELSWLEFNRRVLEEARDLSNPLFERMKFLSITSSNLDEFFMVRVASLKDQVDMGFNNEDISGYTPSQLLGELYSRSRIFTNEQYHCYNSEIVPLLNKENIFILQEENLNHEDIRYLDNIFEKRIYPVLTPMAVDKGRPFPLILNKSLNIGVRLLSKEEDGDDIFATVQVPSVLERIIELPSDSNSRRFMLLEDIIEKYLPTLFRGRKIIESYIYRITRNADLSYDEEGAEDLLETIEKSIKNRKWGTVVRLEISQDIKQQSKEYLMEEFEIGEKEVYYINGPLDLTYMNKFTTLGGCDHLRNTPLLSHYHRDLPQGQNIFEIISNRDVLLHHPYQSFDPIVNFIKSAAKDENVLAIKQTLYRVSGSSPIVGALAEAAENGKQVTVLVELKARFDEENNINWAKRLEKAGCHVIYGLQGLKTHGKMALVVRKEKDGIKRYIHMGTGNYNDVTAKYYTDLGIFTSNSLIGIDASNFFNMLSGFSEPSGWHKINVAPLGLRKKILKLINKEREGAQRGEKARIVAKMNSLVDEEIIEALYNASSDGVNIDLIVRGICCLKPGVKGLSENIRVISVVDRLLEHSRIYYFYSLGEEKIYLSSADWMQRNMDRRVEILFPALSKDIKEEIKSILDITLSDNSKARELKSDGSYIRVSADGQEIRSQMYFYNYYSYQRKKETSKIFKPIYD